jgi:enoyl-CoA hydratase/carnithine racemase
MSESTLVVVDRGDAEFATLTIDRPEKKNALSIALRDAISDQLDLLAEDPELKVLVITGRGSCFSAGFDLDEFAENEPAFQDRLWASSDRFHHAVLRFPVPTIAAVNGAALAGGFDLALMCDIRVAAASAFFGHPEHAFGDVIYGLMHDVVGGAIARDLCLTGRRVDAAEALRLGIVREVVIPNDELLAAATDIAREIARAPRWALIRTKAKAIARTGIALGLPTLDF